MVSTKLSRKELRRREMGQRQFASRLFWGALAALVLEARGCAGLQLVTQKLGVAIPTMAARHIEISAQHEAYNSDPPTSGPHYTQPAKADFYDEALPDEQPVHDLEHGYVIIWYNCNVLSTTDCDKLKADIHKVMDESGGIKLIAFPWRSLDIPVIMTSWGRMERFPVFDPNKAAAFIRANLNHSPEPGAP